MCVTVPSGVSLNLLADLICFSCEGVAFKIFLPPMGSWILYSGPGVRLSARTRPTPLFALQDICREWTKGRGTDKHATMDANTKIRQTTAYIFSEVTHLSRISMCIKCTFLRNLILRQEFLNPWIYTQRKAARLSAS